MITTLFILANLLSVYVGTKVGAGMVLKSLQRAGLYSLYMGYLRGGIRDLAINISVASDYRERFERDQKEFDQNGTCTYIGKGQSE